MAAGRTMVSACVQANSFVAFLLLLLSVANVSASPADQLRQFQSNCSGTVYLPLGHVQTFNSANFPYAYPNGLSCRWIAYSPPGTVIQMRCDHFNLPPSPNCYLDVFYFAPSGDTSLQNAYYYCGAGKLQLTTSGNVFVAGFFTQTVQQNFYPGFACVLTVVKSDGGSGHVPDPNTTEKPKPVTPPPVTDDCQCGVKGASRIVGGQDAVVNEWPWQGGLRFKSNNEVFCGASLLSDQWLVTAAHCVEQFNKEDIYVSLGDHNKILTTETDFDQHIDIDTVIMHENYNPNTVDNDIAVIRLSDKVTFNKGIRPVCLPFKFTQKNFSGTKGTVTGWGQLVFNGKLSDVLQEVELPILTTKECRQFKTVKDSLTDNMICTYKPGFDACKGDSGGPLHWGKDGHQYLVGIVSFGKGCADEGSPGVYTKVTNYVEWIEGKISANVCSPP